MPKKNRKKHHNKKPYSGVKYDGSRETAVHREAITHELAAPTGPSLKELLTSSDRFRERGDRKVCALALHNSEDNLSDTALSLDWLGKSSGFNLLNKKKGKIFFDDPNILSNNELANCKKKLLAYRGSEIVIFLITHGNTGVTFCSQEKGFSDPRAWGVGELKGARLFVDTIKKIEMLFEVNIKGIVLNSCFSGAEIEYNRKFVPSSARLLSSLLAGVPVVGFVGACADSKITRLHLDDTGMHKSLSRHEASVLCQNGIVVDDCHREVRIDHSLTLLSVLLACELHDTSALYNPCGHNDLVEESLVRFQETRRGSCYGVQLLHKALTCAAEVERIVLDLERVPLPAVKRVIEREEIVLLGDSLSGEPIVVKKIESTIPGAVEVDGVVEEEEDFILRRRTSRNFSAEQLLLECGVPLLEHPVTTLISLEQGPELEVTTRLLASSPSTFFETRRREYEVGTAGEDIDEENRIYMPARPVTPTPLSLKVVDGIELEREIAVVEEGSVAGHSVEEAGIVSGAGGRLSCVKPDVERKKPTNVEDVLKLGLETGEHAEGFLLRQKLLRIREHREALRSGSNSHHPEEETMNSLMMYFSQWKNLRLEVAAKRALGRRTTDAIFASKGSMGSPAKRYSS